MHRAARELESILLMALAPAPLYFTGAIGRSSLLIFHGALALVWAAVFARGEATVVPRLMRAAGYLYLLFFPLDIFFLSRDLIRSSSNLLFFIGVYLMLDAPWAENYRNRLLVTFLLFLAAVATSTHLSVVAFVLLFGFFAFRQLIAISHEVTVRQLSSPEGTVSSLRPAAFYLAVCGLVAMAMFPFLPRLGKPVVRGITPGLETSSTGLSDSIDFSTATRITPSADVVARVWMGREAVPFFTPLRLRGVVYDSFRRGKWVTHRGPMKGVTDRFGIMQLAKPQGFSWTVTVQQQPLPQRRLVLPVGAYALADIPHIMRLPGDTFSIFGGDDKPLDYRVGIARDVLPLADSEEPRLVRYEISPEVETFTRAVVGQEREPKAIATRIAKHLSTTFQYVPDPASLGRAVTVEEFLLKDKRGHCEYFAAGMVVMLTAQRIPARIVRGYYGGELNPFTGYFVVRSRDSHAWVEAWTGDRWSTFDPTPESLRPGAASGSLVKLYAAAVGDSVEFFWDRYILTFGTEDQIALISGAITAASAVKLRVRELLDSISRQVTVQHVVLAALSLLLIVLLGRWLARRRMTSMDALLEELRKRGFVLDAAATGTEIVSIVSAQRPELAEPVRRVIELHHLEKFSAGPFTAEMRTAARRALVAIASTR